jgi:3-dehydroquinate synthetase
VRDAVETFELAHPRGVTRHFYGVGAISAGAEALDGALRGRAVVAVSAAPIVDLHADALEPLRARAGAFDLLTVPDGEAAKTVAEAEALWQRLLAGGARRDALVVAFGGGSVSDLAGFAAGAYLRGVDWLAVPTTLLAQVDAAVGGKTGVDLPAAKNAVGVFHHPLAVMAEPALLVTLSRAERRSGLVEVVKTGAILDTALFARVERDLEPLLAGDPAASAPAVATAARVKAGLVAADPEERGPRQLLNFGHTLGHAIEAEIGYGRILHGDAVAHGLRFALRLSRAAGCDAPFAARVEALLDRLGTPPLPPLAPEPLLRRLARDKKARAGGVGWVLLAGAGRGEFGVRLPDEAVATALAEFLGQPASGSL